MVAFLHAAIVFCNLIYCFVAFWLSSYLLSRCNRESSSAGCTDLDERHVWDSQQHLEVWSWLGDLERIFKRGKKLMERNKHFPWASKCHSLDTTRVGDRPLNINPKVNFKTCLKSIKLMILSKITNHPHHFSSQIISKNSQYIVNFKASSTLCRLNLKTQLWERKRNKCFASTHENGTNVLRPH